MSKDYSLWAEAKTKHGLAADEVVSGMPEGDPPFDDANWHAATHTNCIRHHRCCWRKCGAGS